MTNKTPQVNHSQTIQTSHFNDYKTCGRCRNKKKLSDFNKDKYTTSGYRSQCKECMRKERIAMKNYYLNIRSSDEYKHKIALYKRENYHKYKEKVSARNATRRLRLNKPDRCSACNEIKKVEAHHDDYSKPLDIRWLCVECHNEWHIKNGSGLNG